MTGVLDTKPSEGYGVAEIRHPTPRELELIPYHRCHVFQALWYKRNGWSEHPDYEHNQDGVLMYHRASFEDLI